MRNPFVTRAKFDEQAARATTLQDRVRVLEAQLEAARAQASASALEARDSVRMVADWMAQHQFGIPIYGSAAPPLPSETPLLDQLEKYNDRQGRKRARDLVKLGEEQFLRSFQEATQASQTS